MNMKSLRRIGIALLSVVVASCSGEKRTDNIVIRGSNTIGEELAPRLIVEYKRSHPNVSFDLEFKGTQYGMGALMAERCDIAAASREPTTNEQQLARSRGINFDDHVIGTYSVAVIVNADNPVTDLTPDQVRDLFTGTIQNWKEVGGPNAPVHLYIRDPISGTHLGFQELAMEKKPYALEVKTFTNYTGIVQSISNDAGGIGYCSVAQPKNARVKTVKIGGVGPDVAIIKQGKYPYARVLRLYTNKGKETPTATEFVQFVQSQRGQEILAEMGFVPHS